jgi:hypothetical protein
MMAETRMLVGAQFLPVQALVFFTIKLIVVHVSLYRQRGGITKVCAEGKTSKVGHGFVVVIFMLYTTEI